MFEHGFFGNVLSKYYESGDSVINNSNSILSTIKPGEFFLCVGTAIVIGFLISLIYMLTHRKEGYSQSYVLTMIMLPTIVAAILLIINTTAGALTLAGTLTLVRFRSVAGDPKDMAYIFFAMGTGVVCGVGYIGFALVFFAVLAIILFAEIAFHTSPDVGFEPSAGDERPVQPDRYAQIMDVLGSFLNSKWIRDLGSEQRVFQTGRNAELFRDGDSGGEPDDHRNSMRITSRITRIMGAVDVDYLIRIKCVGPCKLRCQSGSQPASGSDCSRKYIHFHGLITARLMNERRGICDD